MKYEYLENEATADLAIRAIGNDLKEAFQNTAQALLDAMVDTDKVEEQEIKAVIKTAKDLKALLYDFLEEILYFHDAEGVVFKTVTVEELDEDKRMIRAVFKGESYDADKHDARNNIKAITYFGMLIKKTKKGYEINLTVDI